MRWSRPKLLVLECLLIKPIAYGAETRTAMDGIAHTYGEGEAWSQSDMGMDGSNPFMDLGNWIVDQAIWCEQIDQIIAKAKKKYGCKP